MIKLKITLIVKTKGKSRGKQNVVICHQLDLSFLLCKTTFIAILKNWNNIIIKYLPKGLIWILNFNSTSLYLFIICFNQEYKRYTKNIWSKKKGSKIHGTTSHPAELFKISLDCIKEMIINAICGDAIFVNENISVIPVSIIVSLQPEVANKITLK